MYNSRKDAKKIPIDINFRNVGGGAEGGGVYAN